MSGTRVLFIGGSGIISSACGGLAVPRDLDLSVLNPTTSGGTFLLINNDTTIAGFKKELRWNDMYYALAKGL